MLCWISWWWLQILYPQILLFQSWKVKLNENINIEKRVLVLENILKLFCKKLWSLLQYYFGDDHGLNIGIKQITTMWKKTLSEKNSEIFIICSAISYLQQIKVIFYIIFDEIFLFFSFYPTTQL